MAQKCATCNREFPNNVALDKHGVTCAKKRKKAPPQQTRKRARPEPQDVDSGHDGPSYNDPTDPPPAVQSARSGRTVRIPRRLMDYVPHGDMSLAHVPPRAPTPPESDDRLGSPPVEERRTEDPHLAFQTNTNKIGVFLRYTHVPSWHPRNEERMDLVCESPPSDTSPPVARETIHELSRVEPEPFEPFPSLGVALYMATYFSGTEMKSEAHATALATMMSKIDPREMLGFNAHTENVRLNKYLQHGIDPFQTRYGWQDSTVYITLPVEGRSFQSEDDAPTLPIHRLYHRRIVDIVKSVCASAATSSFHFTPHSMHWCPDPDKPQEHERVYADTYMSDSMIQAQKEVDELSREEGDNKERVVLGLMLASDSAQLTSFGTASVWPIYLMFANQPKQERVRPTCHAVHHLAYVPSIGADFAVRYQEITGQAPSSEMETHCKRELMQAVWRHLMDEDFVKGCTDGITIRCTDGRERVFYLRIVTYSADYPEKVLLATIKNLGRNPCPRCLILKENIPGVGTPRDSRYRRRLRKDNHQKRQAVEDARKLIFEKGQTLSSTQVQKFLKGQSITATRNAFSERLSDVDQNYHEYFVVDLLHEFEIGVWKSVLTHLIRMLYATPDSVDRVATLDARFHATPTFGRDTIRKLPGNVSELSKLAARDYEDLLQCSIPAFEGLFPEEDDRSISKLLFLLATWHAYAKLRLHTDTTLRMFETVCKALCHALRHFASEICPRYATKELPREINARVARQAKRGGKTGKNSSRSSKTKKFSTKTIKLHFLPDYPGSIRRNGTTDSYSTQTSELAHRLSKMRYRMTNKNFGFVGQIVNKESHVRFYEAMLKRLETQLAVPSTSGATPGPQPEAEDAPTNTDDRYWMSKKHSSHRNIVEWTTENQNDPALRNFRKCLLDHLLPRFKGQAYEGDDRDYTPEDRNQLIIDQDKLYEHKTIRFRSTTYDARRVEESANPRTHADVMVLGHEDSVDGRPPFPYWHARIVGIYHVMVRDRYKGLGAPPSRMDVLFVRWFGFDSPDGQSGWRARQMHKIGFLPDTNQNGPAFGFLDPNVVIRMVHLIPDFTSVRTKELLSGPSIAMRDSHPEGEYPVYYVAMFSDRDLFMRYRGGGVGHLATRQCNKVLLADEHTLLEDEHGELDDELGDEPEREPDENAQGEGEGDEDSGSEADSDVHDVDNVRDLDDADLTHVAGFATL